MKTIQLRKQTGSSLVVVLSVLATLMVVVAVAAEYTNTVNRHVQRSNTVQNAIAVGDSCIEILFAHWRKICSAPGAVLTGQPTSAFTSIPTPSPGELNLPTVTNFVKRGIIINPAADEGPSPIPSDYDANYTISNYKIVAVGPNWEALPDINAAPVPMLGQIAATIASTTSTTPLVYNYIASADVTLPALGPTGKVVAKVRRVIQKQQISPWSYAIFYVDPLEIHPGPDFTVTGWVHTNSDLYTAHPSLTFADKVTYASDWFVGFKPGDRQHDLDIPGPPHYPNNLPPARDQALQPFGLDATALFTPGGNPNDDSYRELIEPPSNTADPLASMRYWDQASVAIKVDGSGVTIGRPETNGQVTSFASLLANPASGGLPWADLNRPKYQALSDMFSTAVQRDALTINDTRESLTNPGKTVGGSILDISQILTNPNSLTPTYKANGSNAYFNGIVYIYDTRATNGLNVDGTVNLSAVKKGIVLKGGSRIPNSGNYNSMGLTVVSNNPVFVQGDFNTGGTGTNVPSNVDGSYSNPATPPSPQVPNYNRAACSILADAVTITSSGWTGASGAPDASANTTVNAAIISGIVPTSPVGGDGAYSGGAENFPRFLEDWGGKMFTYYGSMVELFQSQQSVGKWTSNPAVYNPPNRQWFFDNNFKIKPPPGSLMIHSYIKGKWTVL